MARGSPLYLSLPTVARQERKKKALLIAGGLLTLFFGAGLVGGVLHASDGLREGIPVYLVFLVPSLLLLWRGVQAGRMTEAARRYETIFAADRDGVVTLAELTQQMGQPAEKVFAQLERLFRQGYFQNCTLQRGGEPSVRIASAVAGERRVGFLAVQCPRCGGTTQLRAGSQGVCAFCGGPLSGQV